MSSHHSLPFTIIPSNKWIRLHICKKILSVKKFDILRCNTKLWSKKGSFQSSVYCFLAGVHYQCHHNQENANKALIPPCETCWVTRDSGHVISELASSFQFLKFSPQWDVSYRESRFSFDHVRCVHNFSTFITVTQQVYLHVRSRAMTRNSCSN